MRRRLLPIVANDVLAAADLMTPAEKSMAQALADLCTDLDNAIDYLGQVHEDAKDCAPDLAQVADELARILFGAAEKAVGAQAQVAASLVRQVVH